MVKKILAFFNKKILSPKNSVDLSEWRNWLADTMFYCGIVIIPFAMLFTVPTFLAEKQYALIFIDVLVCSVLILRAFIQSRGYKFWGACWLIIIYIMTISFYIHLGPHYARSAWLVMATVMAALFFGSKGALITSSLNPIILFSFYFFIVPESTIWQQVHEDTFLKYLSFVINASSIALFTSLLVGFLLDRLEISYQKQKLIHERLNESEKRYRLIAENVADVIWTTDMDLTFTYISSSIYQQRGYTAEEALKQSVDKIILPNSLERVMILFAEKMKLIESGDPEGWKPVIFEIEQYHKDGRIIWTGNHVKTLPGPDGKPISILGVTQDITKRKQAEYEKKKLKAQLLQAQKMESIGTLAGGIAHDFNNILSGIFGYSQLAQTHIKNPEKANKCIDQILNGAKRAAELVQQILTFSRKTEYQKSSLRIFQQVDEALKLLRSTIPSTIEIKKKLDSRSMIIADPGKIHQLIMNLCTNAYHAMRKTGGQLTVSLTDVEIFEPKQLKNKKIHPGHYLELEVSDTGHGMDEKTIEKAFDPYYTTKEIGKGTGLGLAIVQAIVDEHYGYLDVLSTPGKGTNFHIYFPIVMKKVETPDSKPRRAPSFKGNEKIMVVDDEEQIRDISKEILEKYGYKISLFNNGIEALKEFKKLPDQFDLIITDMNMSEMAGDKLSVELIKIRPDIPILLCTGFSETITEEKSAAIGIAGFIMKPIVMKDLAQKIREVLDKKKDS